MVIRAIGNFRLDGRVRLGFLAFLKGTQKPQPRFQRRAFGIEKIRRPYPQDIFKAEYQYSDILNDGKDWEQRRKFLKGLKEHSCYVQYYRCGDEHIEPAAGKVGILADLDYPEKPFFAHTNAPILLSPA